jgi:hypothetical protein
MNFGVFNSILLEQKELNTPLFIWIIIVFFYNNNQFEILFFLNRLLNKTQILKIKFTGDQLPI